jgi:hypothetical protein
MAQKLTWYAGVKGHYHAAQSAGLLVRKEHSYDWTILLVV